MGDATEASNAFREILTVVDSVQGMQQATVSVIDEQTAVMEAMRVAAAVGGEGARRINDAIEVANEAIRGAAGATSGIQEQAMRLTGMASELQRLSSRWGADTVGADDAEGF